MGEPGYKIDFETLCVRCNLGSLVNEPLPISGGLLHRIFAIDTTKGKYAVKFLNPHIMDRQTALRNYINSERIANIAAKNIPALPAEVLNGSTMQNIDGQFFLVFAWIEGETLKVDEIEDGHCEKIGGILAEIHKTDFSELGMTSEKADTGRSIDWRYYYQKGIEAQSPWTELLFDYLADLKKWNSTAIEAAAVLSSNTVISHRDLDPKNVLWDLNKPIVIDWESAGFIHPMQDLIETAIYWSTDEKGKINKQRFFSFINGYKENHGQLDADRSNVLANGFLGKLAWLEYNLKRSLWIECIDTEEQKMGTEQVSGTIYEIRSYAEQIPVLLGWLDDEICI